MKVSSLNTLWSTYSNGFSSFRDQLALVKHHIEAEKPDVCVLLEMPNPHDQVSDANLLLFEALWELDAWLVEQGYPFSKRLNDKLSVWVLSKTPLVPLLLLGSSMVSGAISRLFQMAELDPNVYINATSTFADCIAQMGKPDRSIIVGVVSGDGKHVLPLIATHARCLYTNARFGRMLMHLLLSFVAGRGIVVGDFNIEPDAALTLDKQEDFAVELPKAAQQKLLNLPRAAMSHPKTHTAVSVQFPYEPLLLDYFLCKEPLDVATNSAGEVQTDRARYPLPNPRHPSDHKWVSAQIPVSVMLDNSGNRQDSRSLTFDWSRSHSSLLAICAAPLSVKMTAAAAAALQSDGSQTPVKRARSPEKSGAAVVVPNGKATGTLTVLNANRVCGGVLVDGSQTPIFFYSSTAIEIDPAAVASGNVRASFIVGENPRKPGTQYATELVIISGESPKMPTAPTASFE